jgi:hypothetical protein
VCEAISKRMSDDSLRWDYCDVDEVMWDEWEVDFVDEMEEMSEYMYMRFEVFFPSSTLA